MQGGIKGRFGFNGELNEGLNSVSRGLQVGIVRLDVSFIEISFLISHFVTSARRFTGNANARCL